MVNEDDVVQLVGTHVEIDFLDTQRHNNFQLTRTKEVLLRRYLYLKI